MFLQMLIKQQMKLLNLTLADIALKTGIPYKKVLPVINDMSHYECIVNLEKIMTVLGLFTFDNKDVDKLTKEELKKIEKSKDDYITKTIH